MSFAVKRTGCKGGEKVDGGGVAPVQILEYEYDGSRGGQCLKGVRNLPEHPFLRSAEYFFTQAGALADRNKTRHVQQPCGGMVPQHRNEPRAERRFKWSNASKTGRYGSPSPNCWRQRPRPSAGFGAASPDTTSRTKTSTRVVFPSPASPVMKTTWRVPALTLSKQAARARSWD